MNRFLVPLCGALAVAAALAAVPAFAEETTRLIVKLRPDTAAVPQRADMRLARVAEDAGLGLVRVRTLATGAELMALPRAMPVDDARRVATRLTNDPEVEYAVPDRRRHALRVANDNFINGQGYLGNGTASIGAYSAWDVTTGSPTTVVAVLDTGYRPHEDLAGRFLPGYDMIADPIVANDGDGRDADARDPGDWVAAGENTGTLDGCDLGNSSWHGTAVSGIIGSNTNNGAWTAGIDWVARILPVRVLGKCGGYDSDIIDGMAWAGGLAVPGAPANPHPAQVLNMSLGGDGACDASYRNVIAAIYAHGVTRAIVAAAGNSSSDVAGHSPANCPGVIAVSSTTSRGRLANYSNFGAGITISAPGGQYRAGAIGTEGIIVLANAGTTVPAADGYFIGGGTSFAAPMVSGTVALMLSVAPSLTVAQVRDILTSTVKPFAVTTDANGCDATKCGPGIVDAAAAVRAAAATAPPLTTVVVVEYYNATLDHYFITRYPTEQANLDAGNTPTRWVRTGYAFKAYASAQDGTSPVCRYYIPPGLGDSHFFGRGTAECANTGAAHPTFVLEDPATMNMVLPVAGACPAGTLPIYRVFSARPDANHRYMTDPAVRDAMVGRGWVAEGDGPDLVVMCSPA